MNIQGVSGPYLMPHLPNGLDKGLALNITDGSANLGDYDISLRLAAHIIDKPLDLICDVGNGLHGGPQIRAPALLGDNVGVDLSGGQIGILVQILVNEPLIVPQIQICLSAILGNIDLTVLVGAHGTGVHVDIGIQFLRRYLQPPGLQQSPQRGCGDTLPQPRNNAACHKNILCHVLTSRGKLKKEKASIRGQKSSDERLRSTIHILLRLTAICQPEFSQFCTLRSAGSLCY